MSTASNFGKPLAIAVAALLTAACGSTDTGELATEAGPPEGFTRVTFNFSPEEDIERVYQGDLSAFEVRSASGADTTVVGFLDETGTIDIPNGIARQRIEVEAKFPNDEFCYWIALHTNTDFASVVTFDVQLEDICD